jgi:hypothetical protein
MKHNQHLVPLHGVRRVRTRRNHPPSVLSLRDPAPEVRMTDFLGQVISSMNLTPVIAKKASSEIGAALVS